jgi:hypothetical protein
MRDTISHERYVPGNWRARPVVGQLGRECGSPRRRRRRHQDDLAEALSAVDQPALPAAGRDIDGDRTPCRLHILARSHRCVRDEGGAVGWRRRCRRTSHQEAGARAGGAGRSTDVRRGWSSVAGLELL